ncbi:synaptic vesicular amine transporter-like isoform X2 [Hyalella azteca]|uniref:Synaptic vesicular amine transporter-like isoform X2 n=1 Tax=Hyalella azteca TaxID=294128 RepID=A0A8B7NZ95_HYAAZ|nr:synaptic vesicular amine transporter-like isoform X2 [Hyalella azteca]
MQDGLVRCWDYLKELQARCQDSRKLILVIVAIALLLDNMLLTTIVPIFPTYLYELNHPDEIIDTGQEVEHITTTIATTTTTTTSPPRLSERSYHQSLDTGGSTYGDGLLREIVPEDLRCPPCPCKPPDEGGDGDLHGAWLTDREDTQQLDFTASPAPTTVVQNSTAEPQRKLHVMNDADLKKENIPLGLMLSAKAFTQLVTNPFIGPLTYRIGYSIPMFAGFVIMFVSTIIFAFGNSYAVLFIARALQGVGSSCSSVSGMGMLAECYPDDKERGNAMGLALGGLALGVLIGPAFGGIMYEYFNKTVPFLVLAFLALGDGLLQLLVLKPKVRPQENRAPTLKELIQDPYILVAAGAITFANMGIGMLEPSLPIRMMDIMGSSKLEQGTAFLPASISYLIGTNLFGPLGHKMGRGLASFLGLMLSGLSLILIPNCTTKWHLIFPTAGLGFAIGMVDSSMMPELGYLVDLRHSHIYGSVYSIGDVAFCLGFFLGPALSGTLIENIGFDTMFYGMGAVNFLYAPLMYFLINPPPRYEETTSLINEQKSMSYIQYKNDEEE